MAITRTAIVDDDGSLTTGTVYNNAWKQELYDQIDAALAALGARGPVSVASSATPTPNADTTNLYSLTAQTTAAAFGTPTGTPTNGQKLILRLKDDGTARAITYSAAYVAGGVALPSTTVLGKILTIGLIYNSDNALNKWQCVAVSQEA